jgi:hypothetical protein
MKRLLLLGTLALGTACGGDSEDGGSCRERAACGGDIVGSWAVQSVCIVDASIAQGFTEALPEQCSKAVEQTTLSPLDLVVEYTASGMTRATGSLRADVQARFSQACLNAIAGTNFPISNTNCRLVGDSAQAQGEDEYPGSTYSCTQAGSSCLCDISVPTPIDDSGSYAVQGNQLALDGGDVDYCVSGDTLTLQQPEGQFEARRLR